ncbi:MAG: ABC transporter ATP-binding protein, partial [Clostridiales bacterium]|nr:ABC transporter ATP-binding protein [Clostridiales bacterium]
MIQLKNVTKIYGGGRNAVVALDDVSIDFGSKGLVVILGKSGCGKSTLLNILGGLDKPTMGELTVNGRSARSFSSGDYDAYRNTYVGMVFQEFNLIEEITVYQNIEITLKLQERNTDVNTVDEVLKAVGLANLGYRKPSELSGGQRQRVSLARALLKNPQILLADEPTGALDVSTSEEVFEVLKKLAAGQLVVVVTHDRELAFSYGERIIEIVDGRVVSDKMPESEGYSPVKSLSKNVLEVAAGGSITPDEVNQKVAGGTPNYIGISHDRDRIALAYPETFDSFYLPKDRMRLKDTDPSAIKDDGRPFVLRRSALRLADTFKMARVNRKRTKKRFWFIAILNMVCFSLFAVSTMLSAIKLPNVIAKSAFDPYSQSPVGVAKLENRYGGTYYRETDELSEADFRTIESMLGGKKAHKTYTADI